MVLAGAAVTLAIGLSIAGWLDPLAALMFGYLVIQNSGNPDVAWKASSGVVLASSASVTASGYGSPV
jgi:hypothetical protein